MNWLRRLFGKLERRWIRNPDEREEHDEVVRARLKGNLSEEEPRSEAT
jgi:hypothetical protein